MTKDFSTYVKEQRKRAGLSQRKLARHLNISWVTVWRWENNKSKPQEHLIDFWKEQIENA